MNEALGADLALVQAVVQLAIDGAKENVSALRDLAKAIEAQAPPENEVIH